ncbi:MAG: hypothetical protein FD174_3414 [Geobacteraceae bacterium]|nr:MAG: hypothetical protein FD174_3414 [Geobacteraceae bacterium]
MKRRFGKILIMAVAAVLAIAPVVAAEEGCDCDKPYGGYRASPRWGWYGARQNVTTANEARKFLEEFYASSNIRIGTIKERDGYYEAEIYRKSNTKRDRVIIDKGCGRIRSIE